jgi:hypothetical protein
MPCFPCAQVTTVPPPPKGATSTAVPPSAAPVSLGPPYHPRRASTPGCPPFAAQLTAPPLPLHAASRRSHVSSASARATPRSAWLWPLGRMHAVSPLCQWVVSRCAHGPLPRGSSEPRALCEQAMGAVPLGQGQGFGLVAFELFFYFLNIFKSL